MVAEAMIPTYSLSSTLWMRSVSFVALRETLAIISTHSGGIRAHEIDDEVRKFTSVTTQNKQPPSRTTFYHYRNTLYQLGIITRVKQRYFVNQAESRVAELIHIIKPGQEKLSDREQSLFADFVISNPDCRAHFFDWFMEGVEEKYEKDDFINNGTRVAWAEYPKERGRLVRLYGVDNFRERWLSTEQEFQAILYGVRYWARTELHLIDELFLEDRGGVMFPIAAVHENAISQVISGIFEQLSDDDWTVMSLRELAFRLAPLYKITINSFYKIIKELQTKFPQYIVFIPTSQSFASVTAGSPEAVVYQLRGYLRDNNGNYISHIRIHKRVKEAFHDSE
jgi:hypothetical protein